jgi:hypothetical protein
MSIVRNLVKVVYCVCLTGCQTVPGVASRVPAPDTPPPAPTARGQASEVRPIEAEGGVVHLQLSAGGLRGRAGEAAPSLLQPVIDVPPPDVNRLPALQRELARQLNVKIDDLRAKIQALNAQAKARPTPTPEAPVAAKKPAGGEQKLVITRIAEPPPPPVLVEDPAVRTVAQAGPIVPGDSPTASQREINRLVTQCLSDLEKEVRELRERVRALTPAGE